MFNRKTVFVVGAGASSDFEFPFGQLFRTQLAQKLNISLEYGRLKSGDEQVWNALLLHRNQSDRMKNSEIYRRAAMDTSLALPIVTSIDHFLHTHQNNREITIAGKLAIVRRILEAEESSKLSGINDEEVPYTGLDRTWLAKLCQILFEGVPRENAAMVFKNIAIICFNYDRCIEEFLIYALRRNFLIDRDEAAKIVNDCQIFHPYGTAGRLPWQVSAATEVPFGADLRGERLLECAEGIKTFTESLHDPIEVEKMRAHVVGAQSLIFLGFAFHPQNLQLLAAKEKTKVSRIFATALGFSVDDCEIIEDDLAGLVMHGSASLKVKVVDELTCSALFDDFRRSLTA